MSMASDFRKKGIAKTFVTDDGKEYLVMRFPDGSGCILQKVKDDSGASANYIRVSHQKPKLLKIDGTLNGNQTTYQIIDDLVG